MFAEEYDETAYDIVGRTNDYWHAQSLPLAWKPRVGNGQEVATARVLVASGRLERFQPFDLFLRKNPSGQSTNGLNLEIAQFINV